MSRIQLGNYQSGFDRGASRLWEYSWILVSLFFFLPPIPLPSGIRVLLLRSFGAKIGSGVIIRHGVNITFPWKLSVGNSVWIGEGAKILNLAPVSIEANCCISQRAFLCTGSHRFSQPTFDLVTKPIEIKEGSWVAAQVFVGPGVIIGPNSMCVAGSVVLSDVPPDTTVIGNPAILRKARGE
jgi:putative colanic acid biosynthesis acetyltransferase WcaF